MKDLEIRGAGNLLGGEQSGHIAGVGFDLYVRMIGEAVSELKGDGPAEKPEVRVELPVNAHIPHDYVPGERLRLEAYTRIAGDRLRRRRHRGARGADRPVRRAARAGAQPARGGAAADRGPAGRAHRHHRGRATTSGSRRSSCPTRGRSGCSACTRRRCSSRRCVRCSYRCRRLPPSAGSRCGILSCWPGAARSSGRYSPTCLEQQREKGHCWRCFGGLSRCPPSPWAPVSW